MSLKQAFLSLLQYQARPVEYHDISTGTKTEINVSPSNYFRNLTSVEDSVSVGREFVMEEGQLSIVPKRGDKIIDPDFGVSTIKETREMVILGSIVGYRFRLD